MDKKDNWGWIIEIENKDDHTKTIIQVNHSKGCAEIRNEILRIIEIFWKIENKITIKFEGLKDGN